MNSRSANLYGMLLIVWYPLACGLVMGLGKAQYAVMLSIMALNAVVLFKQRVLWAHETWHAAFLIYVTVFSAATYWVSGQAGYLLYFLPLIGTYLFAAGIVKQLTFEAFLRTLYAAAVIFIFLTWFYVLTNMAAAVELMDDIAVLRGFYDQKNVLGISLLLSLTVILLSVKNRPLNGLDVTAALLGVSALYLTSSRTSVAALLLVVVLFILFLRSSRLFITVYAAFWITLGALLLGLLYSDSVVFYGWSAYDGLQVFGFQLPLTGRTLIWETVLQHLDGVRAWLFGYGSHVYFDIYAAGHFANVPLAGFVPHDAHNGYIDLLVNFGIAGLLFFFALLGRFAFLVHAMPSGSPLKLFAAMYVIVLLVLNLTESYFVKTTNINVFLFWVLLLYLEKEHRGSETAEKERVNAA